MGEPLVHGRQNVFGARETGSRARAIGKGGGPRNVLIQRQDGTRVVRPVSGAKKTRNKSTWRARVGGTKGFPGQGRFTGLERNR